MIRKIHGVYFVSLNAPITARTARALEVTGRVVHANRKSLGLLVKTTVQIVLQTFVIKRLAFASTSVTQDGTILIVRQNVNMKDARNVIEVQVNALHVRLESMGTIALQTVRPRVQQIAAE